MIRFPGDDQLENPTGQSFGAFVNTGGAERFNMINANKITVFDIDASTASIKDATIVTAKIGNLEVTNAKINDVTASKITTGALQASQAIIAGSSTGARVQMLGGASGTAAIQLIDSGGNVTGQMLSDGTWYFGDSSGNKLFYDGSSVVLLGVDLDVSDGDIDIHDGATNVARLNINGMIVRNTKGFFMEETTAGQYGDISVNGSNQMVVSLPSTNQYFVQSYNGATNYFTVSSDRTYVAKRLKLEQMASEPSSPEVGDIAYADGTNWNPGSGVGIYAYYNTGGGAAWQKL